MTTLRLIADDLTGALDTAAEFVALTGPVHAFWQGSRPAALPANAAIDLATREGSLEAARAATSARCPPLEQADIAFKKIDSLMRGHTLAGAGGLLHRRAVDARRAGAGLSVPGPGHPRRPAICVRARRLGAGRAGPRRSDAGAGRSGAAGRPAPACCRGSPCSMPRPMPISRPWWRRPAAPAPGAVVRHRRPGARAGRRRRADHAASAGADPGPVRQRPGRHRGAARGLPPALAAPCRTRHRPALDGWPPRSTATASPP